MKSRDQILKRKADSLLADGLDLLYDPIGADTARLTGGDHLVEELSHHASVCRTMDTMDTMDSLLLSDERPGK